MPTAVLSVSRAGLTLREKLFVMLAWLPKATVQAALAAAPLDRILVSQSWHQSPNQDMPARDVSPGKARGQCGRAMCQLMSACEDALRFGKEVRYR
jgi:hypothetical protein